MERRLVEQLKISDCIVIVREVRDQSDNFRLITWSPEDIPDSEFENIKRGIAFVVNNRENYPNTTCFITYFITLGRSERYRVTSQSSKTKTELYICV